jgi:hypothetical protein
MKNLKIIAVFLGGVATGVCSKYLYDYFVSKKGAEAETPEEEKAAE